MNPPQPPEDSGNSGTLILDATAAPADIRHPSDLSLLNECRENTENMIDMLWEHKRRTGHKTAYNRRKARTKYLSVAKQKKPGWRKIQQGIQDQLAYVQKNILTLEQLTAETPEVLTPRKMKRLETIKKVTEQQQQLLESKTRSIPDRILNLRQPHVRPIVRGKTRTPVEFGQKLGLSVINGFTFIDIQSWNNFNEGITLKDSAEKYKARHGAYPNAILADKIYRNRENLRFCKEHGIRLSGPRLGRPKRETMQGDRTQAYLDSCKRNMVEGRIGIAKRRYGMNLIMATLRDTAETEAALTILAMNIAYVLRAFLRLFTNRYFPDYQSIVADFFAVRLRVGFAR
jgi:hypothetical protein